MRMSYKFFRRNSKVRGILCFALFSSLGSGSVVMGQNVLTTLAAFNGTNGSQPLGGVTLDGNTLYGTTYAGGAFGYQGGVEGFGTIFSVPVTGGDPTVMASFNGFNGAMSQAQLVVSGNELYGTTTIGGRYTDNNPYGLVFSIPISGGLPTELTYLSLEGPHTPGPVVVLDGGTLYFEAMYSPLSADGGELFAIPKTGGVPQPVFAGPDPSFLGYNIPYPVGNLVLSNGILYGQTKSTENFQTYAGSIFSVPAAGGVPTILATFPYPISPAGLLVEGNTIYGVVGGELGVTGYIFSLPITGGTPTVLGTFTGPDGESPSGFLSISGNTIYGTTDAGGDYGLGTVFSLPITGGTPDVLWSFDTADGSPDAGVILAGNTLYGTTSNGGSAGDGTVFALTVPEPMTMLPVMVAACLAARRPRDHSMETTHR